MNNINLHFYMNKKQDLVGLGVNNLTTLPRKGKMQYLLTLQVSRYCLLPLQSITGVLRWMTIKRFSWEQKQIYSLNNIRKHVFFLFLGIMISMATNTVIGRNDGERVCYWNERLYKETSFRFILLSVCKYELPWKQRDKKFSPHNWYCW